MEDIHRNLIQFVLRNGAVAADETTKFCNKFNSDINSLSDVENLIGVINTEIKRQHFQIVIAKCEILDQDQLLWLNLKDDEISRSVHTVSEMEYFHTIFRTILGQDHYREKFTTCLNHTTHLVGHLSRTQAEEALNKWIKNRYFVVKENYVYLGRRLIEEFGTYLNTHLPNSKCGLCSTMTLYGKMCNSCHKLFHNHCIDGYLQHYQICPSCDKDWDEAEFIPTQFINTQSTTMEIE